MTWKTTDDPGRECWAHLRDYANEDVSLARIREIHGDPQKKHAQNHKKQARQIRACIRQAEEYFTAAEVSSIVTAPNHLYYGVCSLMSAAMLINGTGAYSLDVLRKDKRNQRHGLTLGGSFQHATSTASTKLLEAASATVEENGFLRRVFEIMPPEMGYALYTISKDRTYSSLFRAVGIDEKAAYPVGRSFNVLSLCTGLPDLDASVRRLGCRARYVTGRCCFVSKSKDEETTETGQWVVGSFPEKEDADRWLELFRLTSRTWPDEKRIRVNYFPSNGIGVRLPFDHGVRWSFPSSRLSLNGQEMFMLENDPLPEWFEAFIVSYIFSMLSRYFPDIWMTCLDSHCGSAVVIRRFVEVYRRKFPQLALEKLSGERTVFSTQPHPAPNNL